MSWVTPEQAAATVRRSPRTVREWYRHGVVKHRKHDKRVLVYMPDVITANVTHPARERRRCLTSQIS